MKLSKYLADYIKQELKLESIWGDIFSPEFIQQGLEVFAIEEDVRIDIKNPISVYYKEQIGKEENETSTNTS